MGDLAILLTVSNTSSQPSWNPLEDLAMLLHYDFMIHAFEAGTIVAIVAGAIGYFVVLPAAVRFFVNFNASEFNVLPTIWNARVTSHVPISGVASLIL